MIVEIGHFALILAFATALAQTVLPMWGAVSRDPALMAMARPSALITFGLVLIAYGALTMAYIGSDFSVANVVMNSHSSKPLIYKISGVWSNHEGSMLLWVMILVLFAALVALRSAEMPERPGGLTVFRLESIFSWSEYAKVQHDVQENDEADLARAADDLDTLSISDDQRSVARALRMNLDRAARAEGAAAPASPAILLPEWDYQRQRLVAAHCSLRISRVEAADPCELPERLRQEQRRLQHQLALLNPERQLRRRQAHGDDIDLDALIRARTDAAAAQPDCYQQVRRNQRDLSCLLLADLSLSTEAAISEQQRVIDVIRDSLWLFSESLAQTRDRFALYGFSSRQRHAVSMVELKRFDETFNAQIRGRIGQIRPAAFH